MTSNWILICKLILQAFIQQPNRVVSPSLYPLREEAPWQKNGSCSNRNPSGAPEDAQREDRVPLRSVWQRIPSRLQTGEASADSHGRETVLLLHLWSRIQPERKSQNTLQSPFW